MAARVPVPHRGRLSRPWSRKKQRGRQKAEEEAMGSQVTMLLLVQLLVRVELDMLGELRPKMPADLAVMGVGWAHGDRGELTFSSPPPRVAGRGHAVCR